MQEKNQFTCKVCVELCVGNCCYIKGAPALIDILEEINQNSNKLEISVMPVFCIGNCLDAPSISIDNKLYSSVSPENLINLINNIIDSE